MTVRLGINPITWSNDDVPELGGDISLERCLSETREAGFLGSELGGKFPRVAEELRAVLAQHDLQLVSGWWDGRILERDVDDEFEAMHAHVTLLRDLGADVVVYADTSGGRHDAIWQPISDRPRLEAGDWDGYGRKLSALAERLADFGVRMAFHHHMGTIVETADEIDRLMDASGPAVGLLFDSGHCAFAGADPVGLVTRHAARVVHVHCKDVRSQVLERARRDDMSFMNAVLDGVFTVPGDGSIDFARILTVLHDAGYAGWLVVEAEQDPRKANPLTYARMGHDNLLTLARGAGFVVTERP